MHPASMAWRESVQNRCVGWCWRTIWRHFGGCCAGTLARRFNQRELIRSQGRGWCERGRESFPRRRLHGWRSRLVNWKLRGWFPAILGRSSPVLLWRRRRIADFAWSRITGISTGSSNRPPCLCRGLRNLGCFLGGRRHSAPSTLFRACGRYRSMRRRGIFLRW